jgi:MFS family permease
MNPAPSPQRPTRVRFVVLAVLCSLAFLTYFDRICISQMKEEISRDLHFTELTEADEQKLRSEGKQDAAEARAQLADARATQRMSYVFWAFILGYGLFEIPGGWLGDRWGPRAVLFRIVVCWSLFTALTGAVDGITSWFTSSPTPWIFLATMVGVRFVFGLGEAGAYPNIGRVLARWFPFRHRAGAQSFIWMSSRFGGAVSPIVVTELGSWAGGWRQAFWILGGLGVLWAFGFYYWFRDRPEEMRVVNPSEIDLIRSDAGPGSIHDEAGHKDVPWNRLLWSRSLWALYVASSGASFCWYFNVFYLAPYVKHAFKVEFQDSRWLSGSPLLVGGVACLLGGWLSDALIRRTGSKRWGRSLPGIIGFGMAGLITLCVPALGNYYLVIAAICLACAFQDPAIPCIWTVSADIGERYAGTVAGCMNAAGGVGASLGLLLAPEFALRDAWNTVFLVNGCVYLIGALAWIRVDASERLEPPPCLALRSEDSASRLNSEPTPSPSESSPPTAPTVPSAHPPTADAPNSPR